MKRLAFLSMVVISSFASFQTKEGLNRLFAFLLLHSASKGGPTTVLNFVRRLILSRKK